ncbi:MAG: undecaprenyl/decaprenyl-phosphate alpha-N-acetylglucosaminyl 1-phosphate transferase [Bacteroidales bacterium]|jgi:UDP-N-acetylmuramyl pentapeptide phosphotransferase/UDP-N-acetylglucosamine-1-phosphate transferase|nr:undecaprenyl/decaprenyl-phosphate alpha-N-acetylglucosaminyl 1-phosphate transferase [Bacteroidales bacterium]
MSSLSNETILLLSAVVSFLATFYSIPAIVRISKKKRIFDEPSQRKSHTQKIPTVGGIAIFLGFALSAGSFISYDHVPSLQYILVSCIIIFFLGLYDDMVSIAPVKKLLGQIVAALVVAIPGNMRLTSLHGFMGIGNISTTTSVLLTVFVIIVIINSLNLIDGVDGLAASIGILATSFFGTWFFLSGNPQYSLLSSAIIGTLFAFFGYNVFGVKNKIFMGDTGSLLVGFLISMQVIFFNEKNIGLTSAFPIKSAPAVSFVVLIIPLYDTIRVFIIRILRGRSPFHADKNHIHHLLLRLGYTHLQTTLLILLANICFIILALFLQNIGLVRIMLIVLSVATVISFIMENRVRKHNHPVNDHRK